MNVGKLWISFTLAVFGFNLYLLLSLNSWFGLFAHAQYLLALVLALVGVVRLLFRRGPSVLQVVGLGALLVAPTLCVLGRPAMVGYTVKRLGGTRVLQDARALTEALGVYEPGYEHSFDHKLMASEADGYIDSATFRTLNPDVVLVKEDAVILLMSNTSGTVENLAISTRADLGPPSDGRKLVRRNPKDNSGFPLVREFSPGVRWHLWGDYWHLWGPQKG